MITSTEIKNEIERLELRGELDIDQLLAADQIGHDYLMVMHDLSERPDFRDPELMEALGFKLRGRRLWLTESAYLLIK
jgi:hypothetical protein